MDGVEGEWWQALGGDPCRHRLLFSGQCGAALYAGSCLA